MELVFTILLFLPLLSVARSSSCITTDRELLTQAFRFVSGFQLPPSGDHNDCSKIREVRLPSRNLTGTVSWMFLRNISTLRTLDLSNNSLSGSIPGGFWTSPALAEVNLAANRLGGTLRFKPRSELRLLNLSRNRFSNAVGVLAFDGLQLLDLSFNDLRFLPMGLEELRNLSYLDISYNSMAGIFPDYFSKLASLRFLNVSFNNFTGRVDSRTLKKFGSSGFIKAGDLIFGSSAHAARSPSKTTTHEKNHKRRNRDGIVKWGLIGAASVIMALGILGGVLVFVRRRSMRKGLEGGWKEEEEGGVAVAPQEVRWLAEAKWSAPVVVFEKPLMELTFSDLAAATSRFGRESQLAEGGRSGPVYRAVLPGDMHVVVRVLESASALPVREATAAFRELARLRHPNLLPLLGYCIPGREKLLLYEYMERGDLHRWLHELPDGRPNVEDWSGDTWEIQQGEERRSASKDWLTRHRIALGIARGLAFLHQGWVGSRRAVVHGHLVPSNVLLGEDLEPRIADFTAAVATGGAADTTAEGDVYSYGVVVMELVTGRSGWSEEEVERVRKLVREGRGVEVVDPRMLGGGDGGGFAWEREMVETLQVGYLCTAQSPEKRPTMQQVVGLLKDVRPTSSAATATAASSSFSC